MLSSLSLPPPWALAYCVIDQHILETKQVSGARKAISLSPARLINNSPEIESQRFVLALIFIFDTNFVTSSLWLVLLNSQYIMYFYAARVSCGKLMCIFFSSLIIDEMLNVPGLTPFLQHFYLCFQLESKSWGVDLSSSCVRKRDCGIRGSCLPDE